MNHLKRIKMNHDMISMVEDYPEIVDRLDPEYRIELFKLSLQMLDPNLKPDTKTKEIAYMYNTAKGMGIKQPLKVLSDILDVPISTVNRRLHMARESGLVAKISGNLKKAP